MERSWMDCCFWWKFQPEGNSYSFIEVRGHCGSYPGHCLEDLNVTSHKSHSHSHSHSGRFLLRVWWLKSKLVRFLGRAERQKIARESEFLDRIRMLFLNGNFNDLYYFDDIYFHTKSISNLVCLFSLHFQWPWYQNLIWIYQNANCGYFQQTSAFYSFC
jgi:hypothetical protein